MSGFFLYSSNDQHALLSGLAEIIKTPTDNLLEADTILIQSLGMKRWISLQLANQLGIFANADFQFPNEILNDLFSKVIPNFESFKRLDRETQVWKIIEVLPACLKKPSFVLLKNYLLEKGEIKQIKSYQLARRIAYVFEQYEMYRPEMIQSWNKGQEKEWQPELWRIVNQNEEHSHLSDLKNAFYQNLTTCIERKINIPERIFVFGITSLPPLHIEILSALSEYIDIHLFFLNPTTEYWSDISSERDIARTVSRQKKEKSLSRDELYLEKGNSLLASLGKTGKNFFMQLMETDFIPIDDLAPFKEPGEVTLLSALQSDILHLQDRGSDNGDKKRVAFADHSLQIHSTHSHMREIEVLYDQLLWTMDQDPDLKPGDVLVMAPEIDAYVPFIKSVFDSQSGSTKTFPFSIADQGVKHDSKVIQYFLNLLDLANSRFGITTVMDLLESEAVSTRFSLSKNDRELLKSWLGSANIRWGVNDEHRQDQGTPPVNENSWEFGLDRILLGIAMPDQDGALFNGILPFDGIEGSQTLILGRFLDFFSQLKTLIQPASNSASGNPWLSQPLKNARTLSEWHDVLVDLLGHFFHIEEDWENEVQTLQDCLKDLKEAENSTHFTEAIEFEVICDYLHTRLEKEISQFGFLGAGITFCSLLPMRSIPFKVIALLGMNEHDFPRHAKPLSFDLIAKSPRRGDRSQKEDDRYLFLETLISAKQVLYISYIGRHIKDNTVIPPSSIVSELRYYLEQGYQAENGDLWAQLFTQHSLQAFHPNYFKKDSRLPSYSRENLEAARILMSDKKAALAPFIDHLPEPNADWKQVSLDQLISFFDNPSKYLIKNRLGVFLEEESALMEENEPFFLDHLSQYQIKQELIDILIEGKNPRELHDRLNAKGIMPLKNPGRSSFKLLEQESHSFYDQIKPQLQNRKLEPLDIEFKLNDFFISGRITGAWRHSLIHYRCAKIKTKDRLTSWIEQLVVNYLQPADYPLSAMLIGLDDKKKPITYVSAPIASPESNLVDLLKLYWQGLQNPLPFFAQTSAKYVEVFMKTANKEKALKGAKTTWAGYNDLGEMNNPYICKCFGAAEPLQNPEFTSQATTILVPVYNSQKKA